MKKSTKSYILTISGLVILAVALYLLKALSDPSRTLETASYLGIGLGCGIFGHGLGEVISRRALKNSPQAARQLAIEQNDERNLAIGNRAKAKAYDTMLPLFGALFFAFALMGVDMVVILLLVAAYLFICGSSIYYRIKYEKEM